MAEVTYSWPSREDAKLLGTRKSRIDGPLKSTGAAKYTYDVNLPNQLIAVALGSPHAHCRVKSLDTAAAGKVPGVVHVHVIRQPGEEIQTEGDLIAVVAAETEGAARDGVAQLAVEYELLDVFVREEDLEAAEAAGAPSLPVARSSWLTNPVMMKTKKNSKRRKSIAS